MARHDKIVIYFQKLIAEKGENEVPGYAGNSRGAQPKQEPRID